jgi:carbamate kinase
MLIVVALGGNALLQRGESPDADTQLRNVERASKVIAELAQEHRVVVTHGNGPQVGLLALQSEAYRDVRSYPLDVLGAETEGMIGYLLQQALDNALPRTKVAALLTQVVVDAHDPAFLEPTKPVGPRYLEDEAAALETERGWAMAADGVAGWRRVVASPRPHEVVERATIDLLVDAGVLVICSGGGGIPVVRDDVGRLRGVEAVVDKDRTAALLARQLGADRLLLLTDVDAVYANHGRPGAQAIRRSCPGLLRAFDFDAVSMGPKVEAASNFATATGNPAHIGRLDDAEQLLAGRAGTEISVDADFIAWYPVVSQGVPA